MAALKGATCSGVPFLGYAYFTHEVLARGCLYGLHGILDPEPVIFKETLPLNFEDSQNTFFHDIPVHLGSAQAAIDKCNRHFDYFETQFPGGKFHFYLEGVSHKINLIKIDGFQYLSFIADKTCGLVIDRHPGNQSGIYGSAPGQK